jgi:Na+/alanine symporter
VYEKKYRLPGATFSGSVHFVECTLAQKYRVVAEDGTVSGGRMHYLYKGLARGRLGGRYVFNLCVGVLVDFGEQF